MENNIINITSLSSKGQIVLPKKIRDELSLKVGDKLIIFSDGKNILLKPIFEPEKKEFYTLMEQAEEWANKVGMEEKDIEEAISYARRKSKNN